MELVDMIDLGSIGSNIVQVQVLPIVILNGRPEFCEMKGENLTPSGAVQLPPINVWKRESKAARPYSLLRSYWFAGNEAGPSVLLLALPTVK